MFFFFRIATLLDPRFKEMGFIDREHYSTALDTLKAELRLLHRTTTSANRVESAIGSGTTDKDNSEPEPKKLKNIPSMYHMHHART